MRASIGYQCYDQSLTKETANTATRNTARTTTMPTTTDEEAGATTNKKSATENTKLLR